MTRTSSIVVVGAGPTGLTVVRALAEAALPVLWLEAGEEPPAPPRHTPDRLAGARLGAPGAWKTLLRSDLGAATPADLRSPKLRLAAPPGFTDGFEHENLARTDNFAAIGALTAGGLANLWGAFAPAWDATALNGLDLRGSYARVAKWMGLAGENDGPLASWLGEGLCTRRSLPLSPLFTPVWAGAGKRPSPGFALDRPRLAVESERCDGCGACLWGCGAGAVWDGRAERARLAALPNVDYRPATAVERIEAGAENIHRLDCRKADGSRFGVETSMVVLAAGALATPRLALDRLGRLGEEVRIENNPALSFALLAPARLGAPLPQTVTGLAQLCFRQDIDHGESAFGMLYDAGALPAPDLIQALPFSRAGNRAAIRLLMPAMAVGFLYLPGRCSDNRLRVERIDGMPRLTLRGGTTPDCPEAFRRAARRMGRALRPLGLWLLPGSTRPTPPGAECHYGAALAGIATDGCLTSGLYAADASVLPGLESRHHTFTAMANADCIARKVAAIWTESA